MSKDNGSTMGGVDCPQIAADIARMVSPFGELAPVWLDGDEWDVDDRSGRLLRLCRRSDGAEVLVEIKVGPWVR